MPKNKKNRKNVNPPSKSYKTYFPTKIPISFRKVSVNSPYLRLKISSGAVKPFLGCLNCDPKICDKNDSKADLILSPLSGAIMPCFVSYLTNGSSGLPLIDPFAEINNQFSSSLSAEPSSGNCRASKSLDLQGHRDSGAGSTECSTSEQSDLPSSAIVNVVPSLGVKSSDGDMLVEVSSKAPEFDIPCSHVADVCSPSPPESSSILPHIDFASNPPHEVLSSSYATARTVSDSSKSGFSLSPLADVFVANISLNSPANSSCEDVFPLPYNFSAPYMNKEHTPYRDNNGWQVNASINVKMPVSRCLILSICSLIATDASTISEPYTTIKPQIATTLNTFLCLDRSVEEVVSYLTSLVIYTLGTAIHSVLTIMKYVRALINDVADWIVTKLRSPQVSDSRSPPLPDSSAITFPAIRIPSSVHSSRIPMESSQMDNQTSPSSSASTFYDEDCSGLVLTVSSLSGAIMPCFVSYLTNGSSGLPLIDPFAPAINNQFSSSLSAEEELSLLLEVFKDLPSTYSSTEIDEWTSNQLDEFLEELLLTSNDLPSLYASTELDELTSLELEELLEFFNNTSESSTLISAEEELSLLLEVFKDLPSTYSSTEIDEWTSNLIELLESCSITSPESSSDDSDGTVDLLLPYTESECTFAMCLAPDSASLLHSDIADTSSVNPSHQVASTAAWWEGCEGMSSGTSSPPPSPTSVATGIFQLSPQTTTRIVPDDLSPLLLDLFC